MVKKAIKTKKIVTVEVENINQLKQILGLKFKRILFDNMNSSQLKKCIKLCKNKYQTEYSGNATLKNIKQISKTGIDISISQTNISQGTLPVGKILVIRDISSRKEVERSYKNLIKSSGDIIYNLDIQGNFTFVNPIFEKITGYTRKEVIGKDTNFMVH